MKESDIRNKIRDFVDGFDRGVRKVVLPATLGLGLALSSGCGPEEDLAQRPTAGQSAKSDHYTGEGPVALYAAPFPGPDTGLAADAGVPSPPPVALYSAPFPTPDTGLEADAGVPSPPPVALYSAPFPEPDAGVTEDAGEPGYDGGAVALYAAPFPEPDAGTTDDDDSDQLG